MKSKKKRPNDAVSDIIGTVLMLGMAISLIALVYLSVLSYPFTPSPVSADLIGSVDGNSIIIEHHGGDALGLDTEIVITVGGNAIRVTVEDYLDDESKEDGLWNIGERVVYSDETLTSLQVKVAVVDTKSNSAILMGILQEEATIVTPSLVTSVDTISPYIQTSSPFTVDATGDSGLDNVTLYYRWSDDNTSWDGSISNETNHTVDGNTTNVDSSDDVGNETNFVNAQDTTPDSDYMNIQENDTGVSAVNEWRNADDHTEALTEWDTHANNGDANYVTAADDDIATHSGSYIHEANNAGREERLISFENTAETGSGFTVNISIRMATQDGANNDGFDLYYDKTGVGSSWSSAIEYEATAGTNNNPVYAYTTHELPETLTATEINNLVIYLDTENDAGGDDRWVDHIRMGISRASTTNYTIDFEYNWSNVDYDEPNEEVCIYVDSHTGSEDLNVSYWTGSSWTRLGLITGTGWTNLTATGLTSDTYTIRLNGTSESSDISQDDWDIDVISLHTWNSTQGVNWGIWSPDTSSPWSWDFDFPNGNGYYEFYSIGMYDSDTEDAPSSADAICKYEG